MFLEQGFDSLSLAQVSVAVEQEFGVKVGFSKLMNQFPTIGMLAAHLEESLPAASFASAPSRPASQVERISQAAPLAYAHLAGPVDSSLQAIAATVAEQGRILASIQETLAKLAGPAPSQLPTIERPAPRGLARSRFGQDHRAPARHLLFLSASRIICPLPTMSPSPSRLMSKSLFPKSGILCSGSLSATMLLRAVFDQSGSVMRIVPEVKLDIPVKDLSGIGSEHEQQQMVKQLAIEEAARPFAVPSGPLRPRIDSSSRGKPGCRYPHRAPCHLRWLVHRCPHSGLLRLLF